MLLVLLVLLVLLLLLLLLFVEEEGRRKEEEGGGGRKEEGGGAGGAATKTKTPQHNVGKNNWCLLETLFGIVELFFGSENLMPMKAGNQHDCNRLRDEKRSELHLEQSSQPVITVYCLDALSK